MQNKSPAYLINRILNIINANQLNIKDLALDMLMAAFNVKIGGKGQHVSITMEINSLASHLADKLASGKFVYIRDPETNRTYFVTARRNHLIAVFYAIAPAINIYSILASHPAALEGLGLEGPTFRDNKIIDTIFGFREADDLVDPVPEISHHSSVKTPWQWHTVQVPAKGKEDVKADENKTQQVEVPVTGAAKAETAVTAAQAAPNTAMAQAFERSQQQNHGNPRRHHDQKHGQRQQQQHPQQTAEEVQS